ncbi:peptide chain release factor N(5)-glutamine methyltransferase [Tepidibacter aestuarii]|uniref:peptide chain release factor N(5)-glutamine methyltransferase n=1 Tax=Tepidibacter aestuarii TaxID=2925782 RepID=UPI0020BE7A6C|nr:peptide chain release factor N(5)-glutamine methyltransferase [Tepidibacter aestuarii]CAH2215021.1 Release factor glutamine methyltransferase [Tepidibacter aestuarii]
MTIRQMMKKWVRELSNSTTAKLDVELAMCKVLDVTRLYIHLNLDEEISKKNENRIEALLKQRRKGRPMAYIIGKKEFMGLDFFVKEGVLIPRPDTEVLVEDIIEQAKKIDNPLIVDIGTGSGAISVSLAKYINGSKVYSLDISDDALEVGSINAKNNEVEDKITFLKSNVFSALENEDVKFDIIVSNPPYIRRADISGLEVDVKDYEPSLALDGGEDGLDFYRNITQDSIKFIKDNGILGYEVGYDQAEDVKKIMIQNGYGDIRILEDLASIERVVIGTKI